MSPEHVELIRSILHSDDLAIGITTADAHRPFTFAGGGEKVRVTRCIAETILSLIERHWGCDAPEAIVLRGLIDLRPARPEGGAP